MPTDIATQVTNQSANELKPIIRQILGEDARPTGKSMVAKIGSSTGQATAGIFHVSGNAQSQAGETEWSAVVKVLGRPEHAVAGLEHDPLREVEVYRSQAFADVQGGVRASRCYAIQKKGDLLLLWLEDLSGAPQPPWALDQYVTSARHLGRFNANWPESALPQWTWLNREGFRSDFTGNAFFQTGFSRFMEQQDHPLARRFVSQADAQTVTQHWDTCDFLLVRAEEMPRGVCHRDCHSGNLFPVNIPGTEMDNNGYTIAIDWSKVGIDNIGIDIGHLLVTPINQQEFPLDDAIVLRDQIFDAYVSGLEDSGWRGNQDAVRLTYLTRLSCEALRRIAIVSYLINDAEGRKKLEVRAGLPATEIAARNGASLNFYFTSAKEALELAAQL